MNRLWFYCIIVLGFIFPLQIVAAADWSQDGGNAQRTGYTSEEPVEPWSFQWSFNGADSSGGTGNHFYNAPSEARTIVGRGNLFIPAGSKGIYAISLASGSQVWTYNPLGVKFNAAPVLDSIGFVYVGGSNGFIYKLNAATGQLSASYNASSPVNKALLLVDTKLFAVSDDGKLHSINTTTMTANWIYIAGSTVATLPSYSATANVVIYATDDLYVHAVNGTDGSRKWRVKPTPNNPGDPTITSSLTASGSPYGTQFERGFPVIAEKSGIVLLRMQLPHQALYEGPNSGRFGITNAENKTWLAQNTQYKNLFALNLNTGAEQFVAGVGYGSTEDFNTGSSQAYGVMGTQPVVKDLGDGKEVAYIPFRSGQTTPTVDYRWSGHMGEMVLDNTTVSGLSAGDLRFIKMNNYSNAGGNSPTHIIDEQTPLMVAGNSLLYAHWAASTSVKITDRSSSLGLTYTNPINTSFHPPIYRAIKTVSCKDVNTRWSGSCSSLNFVTDGGRGLGGPGWWEYWNVADPPGWRADLSLNDSGGNTGAGTSYSSGFLPRYTYVSSGYIIVEGNGGDIMVLKHSGTVGTNPTSIPTVLAQPLVGDGNNDGHVNGADYVIWLTHYSQHLTGGASIGDYNKSGVVDGADYILWLSHYGT